MNHHIEKILIDKFPEFTNITDSDLKDDFWYDLDDKIKYKINELCLRQIGNPEYDYLVCWEPGRFGDNEQVTDFNTMYDVDYAWWEFQKTTHWKSIEDMKSWLEKTPDNTTAEKITNAIKTFNNDYSGGYSIYMSGDWYRLIDNGKFIYSQCISAKWYLFYIMEEYLTDLQAKYSACKCNYLSIYSTSIDICEYQKTPDYDCCSKIRNYQNLDLLKHIDESISKYSGIFYGKTFRIDRMSEKDNCDPFTDFIFFDDVSLTNVKPKQFLKTFGENQLNFIEFKKMIDSLKYVVFNEFETIHSHCDVAKHDPTN